MSTAIWRAKRSSQYMSTTCLEYDDIALVVGDRAGRRIEPVDEEGRHLHFGKGAAHAVAVDHRHARVSGGEHRLDRVRAADLGRDQRRDAHARRLLDAAQRAQAFLALLDLLDADDRRADAADRADVIVVADRLERQDLGARAFAHEFAQAQHADVGIAAAAGPEQRRAERKRKEIALVEPVGLRRHAGPPRP